MYTQLTAYIQLMQSLFLDFPIPFDRSLAYEQLQALEHLQHQLLTDSALPWQNRRLQMALNVLHRLACMEIFYRSRYRALAQVSPLSEPDPQPLKELAHCYRLTLQRLQNDWPELDKQETEALPRLLLLQRIEQEINQLNHLFKFQPGLSLMAA